MSGKPKSPSPLTKVSRTNSDLQRDKEALSRMYFAWKAKGRPPVAPQRVAPVLKGNESPTTLPTLAASQWSQSARLIQSSTSDVCSMDQDLFFNFVRWLEDPKDEEESLPEDLDHKIIDLERWVERTQGKVKAEFELQLEEEKAKVREVELKFAQRRRDFIKSHTKGKAIDAEWFCSFVTTKMQLKAPVRALLGVGVRSFVAIVVHKGHKRALRVTHASEGTSDDERHIQNLLGNKGLAPRVLGRKQNEQFRYEIMELMVSTFDHFVKGTKVDALFATEVARAVLFIMGQLKALKVVHGDLHPGNIGLTASGKLLIYDFDLSSSKYSFPGFDLAIFYGYFVEGSYDFNEEFIVALEKQLRPFVHKMWFDKEGVFKGDFMWSVRQKWANVVRYPTKENKRALVDKVGLLNVFLGF